MKRVMAMPDLEVRERLDHLEQLHQPLTDQKPRQ